MLDVEASKIMDVVVYSLMIYMHFHKQAQSGTVRNLPPYAGYRGTRKRKTSLTGKGTGSLDGPRKWNEQRNV